MLRRNAILSLAAAAALAGTVSANAAPASAADTDLSLQPKYLAEAPPPPDRPIMYGLSEIGVGKALKDLGISITGHVEGSYTYNFESPPHTFPENAGRVFDVYNKDVILNQFDITINRDVDRKKLDFGGTVEFIYGRDARFIHANGLFDYHNDDVHPPVNQWDLTQAFAKISIPVGNGIEVWAGKMVTHMGYEVINPTGNPLFSHSYLFGYAIPFTHTGVMAYYSINNDLQIMLGFSRGWDQATEDNNDSIDLLGQVKYTTGKWTFFLNFTAGPEQANDNSHWRTVFDGIVTYAFSDELTFTLNGDFGYDAGAAPNGDAAKWYGIAAYATYKLSDYFSFTGRGEWFDDADGVRTGVDSNYYEVTIGATITPFAKDKLLSNLMIRPEFRADFADSDVFDGGTKKHQETVAVDVIVKL